MTGGGLKFLVFLSVLVPGACPVWAAPAVKVSVAKTLSPWQHTTVRITIRSRSARPVLPVWVRLESRAGKLQRWGHRGTTPSWVSVAFGRKSGRSYRVLFTPHMPQQIKGPVKWPRTDTRLVRLRPMFRGEVNFVTYRLQASYNHRGRLMATVGYLELDPRKRPVCLVSGSTAVPRKAVFRSCNRVRHVGFSQKDRLYMEEAELTKGLRTVSAGARFSVRRPAYDLPQARKRARVARGPVGYDTKENRWILVDPRRGRTLVVPRRGKIISLPGDWRIKLLDFNDSDQAYVYWSGRTAAEAAKIKKGLIRRGIATHFFTFKGRRSPTRLTVLFKRRQVAALGRFMKREGARMKRYYVAWGR